MSRFLWFTVYNFDRVCESACLSDVNSPLESLDVDSSYLHIMYSSSEYASVSVCLRLRIQNSQISTYSKMWTFMSSHEDVFVDTTEAGVDRVRNSKGKYAFHHNHRRRHHHHHHH